MWSFFLLLLCPSLQEPVAAADFDVGLTEIEEAMQRRRWKSALGDLQALLEDPAHQAYALQDRARIEEIARRCLFWMEHGEVHPKQVVDGKLRKYKASSGDIEVVYDKDQLGDFQVYRSGVAYEPVFTGPFTVELEGRNYPFGTFPRFRFGLGAEEEYMVWFGQPSAGSTIYPASLYQVTEDEDVELDDQWTTPLEHKGKFTLKVRVAKNMITAWANKQRILSAKRKVESYGRFSYEGLKPSKVEQITISGRVEPSWIAGLIDQANHEKRDAFEAELDLGEHLPAWLLEGGAEAAEASTAAEAGAPAAEAYPPQPFDEPGRHWPRIQGLIDAEDTAKLAELLDKLPSSSLTELERHWAEAKLADLRSKPREAVPAYAKVCSAAPAYLPARARLVELLFEVQKREEAVRELERLVHDFPEDDAAARDWVFYLMGESRLEEARAFLDAGTGRPGLDSLHQLFAKIDGGPSFGRSYSFETKHYRVVSDIDKGTCAESGRLLERYYNAYSSRLRKAPRGEDHKFPVYLFSGFAGYERYVEDIGHGNPGGTAGIYSLILKQLLIWNLPDRESMMKTVIHEGFHQYLDSLMPDPPVWFNEGMAEYFELSGYEGGRWIEGQVNRRHLSVLLDRRRKIPSLRQLVEMTPSGFYTDMTVHYAMGWAFVHYLRQGGKAEQAKFRRFFDGLCDGEDSAALVAEVFGGPEQLRELEKDFRAHLLELDDRK